MTVAYFFFHNMNDMFTCSRKREMIDQKYLVALFFFEGTVWLDVPCYGCGSNEYQNRKCGRQNHSFQC